MKTNLTDKLYPLAQSTREAVVTRLNEVIKYCEDNNLLDALKLKDDHLDVVDVIKKCDEVYYLEIADNAIIDYYYRECQKANAISFNHQLEFLGDMENDYKNYGNPPHLRKPTIKECVQWINMILEKIGEIEKTDYDYLKSLKI